MTPRNALIFFAIFAAFGIGVLGIYFIFGGNSDKVEPKDKVSGGNFPQAGSDAGGGFFDFFSFNQEPVYPIGQNFYNEGVGTTAPPLYMPKTESHGAVALTSPPPKEYPLNYPVGGSYATKPEPETKIGTDTETETLSPADSQYKGKITIGSVRHDYSYSIFSSDDGDPDNEYVEIYASEKNTDKVLISGFELRSGITGRGAFIGKGTYLPSFGVINKEEPIFLKPGEKAYVITGTSPVGYSFKVNKCSGYWSQFQQFTPPISTSCPGLKNEKLPDPPNTFSDACVDYIDSFQNCRIRVDNPTKKVEPECVSFIDQHTGYTYCASKYSSDADFYKNEWRVYLNRLWKSRREMVKLLDQNGKIIDIKTY